MKSNHRVSVSLRPAAGHIPVFAGLGPHSTRRVLDSRDDRISLSSTVAPILRIHYIVL